MSRIHTVARSTAVAGVALMLVVGATSAHDATLGDATAATPFSAAYGGGPTIDSEWQVGNTDDGAVDNVDEQAGNTDDGAVDDGAVDNVNEGDQNNVDEQIDNTDDSQQGDAAGQAGDPPNVGKAHKAEKIHKTHAPQGDGHGQGNNSDNGEQGG